MKITNAKDSIESDTGPGGYLSSLPFASVIFEVMLMQYSVIFSLV